MMPIEQNASVRIAFNTCIRHEPDPDTLCPPPGYTWIPTYLAEHGGELTPSGRNWMLDQWDTGYQAALEKAEQDYQTCLQGRVNVTTPQTGMQMRVSTKLDARTRSAAGENASTQARVIQVNVPFSSTSGTTPCDSDGGGDEGSDPNAPPVSVPKSVFWKGVVAYFDLDALQEAIEFPFQRFNPDNPQSVRYLQLTPEGVISAVRIAGHTFHPIPPNVEVVDDLRVDIQVTSIRLDIASESIDGGGVLDTWSVLADAGDLALAPDHLADLGCYYWGGCENLSPPPPRFGGSSLPAPCMADHAIRAVASPISLIRVFAGEGQLLGTAVLTINRVGTIDARPIVSRQRVFNANGVIWSPSPHLNYLSLPPVTVALGPAAIGATVEVPLTLPACLVDKVELAPDQVQLYLQSPSAIVGIEVVAGATPGTYRLRLMKLATFYHWDDDLTIAFVPLAVDVRIGREGPPYLAIPVHLAWDSGCESFWPERDSLASVTLEGWRVASAGSGTWRHDLTLRVIGHEMPCDAFFEVIGSLWVTWPDGQKIGQTISDSPTYSFARWLNSNAPPSVTVEIDLTYVTHYRQRRPDGSGFDTVMPHVIRTFSLTP